MTPSALERGALVTCEAVLLALRRAGDVEDVAEVGELHEEPGGPPGNVRGTNASADVHPDSVDVEAMELGPAGLAKVDAWTARSGLRRATITPRFTPATGNRLAPRGSVKKGDRSKKTQKR